MNSRSSVTYDIINGINRIQLDRRLIRRTLRRMLINDDVTESSDSFSGSRQSLFATHEPIERTDNYPCLAATHIAPSSTQSSVNYNIITGEPLRTIRHMTPLSTYQRSFIPYHIMSRPQVRSNFETVMNESRINRRTSDYNIISGSENPPARIGEVYQRIDILNDDSDSDSDYRIFGDRENVTNH